ncbi:MAG: cell division protein SepF [Actinobacteria bacterium]|nr:cell division protein SepF [Cyanobacteriota bacterium]MCL6088151.1 cell division protein SepF [Actinomycetota bacterium]
MPGFFKKTLTFLGFIDENTEENIPQKYQNDKRTIKYQEENRDIKLYRINDRQGKNIDKAANPGWFRNQRKITKLEEVKLEKKTKVFVIEPNGYEDSQIIGDKFKNDIPVIVNLQNESSEVSRRIIDFCSGLTYALSGSIEKVADKVFLITPSNVEVTSDEKEILRGKGLYEDY